MHKLLKNGLYILTLVAFSFFLCKYMFNTTINNQWLFGALIVPLIILLLPSIFKKRNP
jgi:hypothetical protein